MQPQIPRLEIGKGLEFVIDILKSGFSSYTKTFSKSTDGLIKFLSVNLSAVPPYVFIAIFFLIIFFFVSKRLAIGSSLALVLIWSMRLWDSMIITLVLVLFSTAISILIGIPIGILSALNNTAKNIINPILDFMQTLPSFVYLIPAIPFFGIGSTSALFSTVFFAIPPVIRLTSLGIRQIDKEIIEACDSFGSTMMQKLLKVQVPLAMPTIMTGINQTIMMSLSMVVVSAMIGVGGLGKDVLMALQGLNIGKSFEAGLSVVILAITLDRISQSINKKNRIS